MNEEILKQFAKWGRKGGKTTAKRKGKDFYARIGRKGSKSRWAKEAKKK